MKGEIEEVMLEGIQENELTVGVYLDKTIGVGDHKQCNMCNQKQLMKERFHYQYYCQINCISIYLGKVRKQELVSQLRPV